LVRILIAAATNLEVAPILERMKRVPAVDDSNTRYTFGPHDIRVLITGVGMVATAVWCSRVLTQTAYDLALNFGVCGSFDAAIPPGTVVHVVTDRLAELGAEDGDEFLPLEDLHLAGESAFANLNPPANRSLDQLPKVAGITVNTVHGSERTIASVARRFQPQVESMEGAAFMSACLIQHAQFAQVRAVSNFVERRNRGAWKITEAIANLNAAALRILEAS
jgi:futalosine hydrolase